MVGLVRKTTRTVRGSSLPVEYISDRVVDVSHNIDARRISNAALDDTDALMSASKRHDQELLSDINARLATAAFSQPVTVKRSTTTRTHKPPIPPHHHQQHTTTTQHILTSKKQPGIIGLSHNKYYDDDDDINIIPPTPVTKSIIRSSRSSSVPPRLPTVTVTRTASTGLPPRAHHHRHVTSKHVVGMDDFIDYPTLSTEPRVVSEKMTKREHSYVENHPDYIMFTQAATRPQGLQLTPVADLAVRQAHRNLDRIDRELKYTAPHVTNSPPVIVQKAYVEVGPEVHYEPARRTSYRTQTSYRSTPTFRTGSLSPARTFQHRVTSPVRSEFITSELPVASVSALTTSHLKKPMPSVRLSHELPASVRRELITPVRASSQMQEVHHQLFPTEMYMTRTEPILPHFVRTEPVLPSPLGHVDKSPVSWSSDSQKFYGEPRVSLVEHQLATTRELPLAGSTVSHYVPPPPPTSHAFGLHSRSTVYHVPPSPPPVVHRDVHVTRHVSSLPPTLPPREPAHTVDSVPIPQPMHVRPKVSETRRKVREVLCKVKKDPHYFD